MLQVLNQDSLWWSGSVDNLLLEGGKRLNAFDVIYKEDICEIYIKCQCIIKEKMINWTPGLAMGI